MDARQVRMKTTAGEVVVELNEEKAPVTVGNFLQYVEDGFYDGTIFHRVISDFMVQGGGLSADMESKQTREAIVNEATNGLKNNRGTLAMARAQDPDSATAQFFINHKDNDFLNYVDQDNPGYAVFGCVAEGMDVVDQIASVATTTRGMHSDVPAEPVVIESAAVVAD